MADVSRRVHLCAEGPDLSTSYFGEFAARVSAIFLFNIVLNEVCLRNGGKELTLFALPVP